MRETESPPDGFLTVKPSAGFATLISPLFERIAGDAWARGFRVADKHVNGLGYVHGGMLMAFMDIILATAISKAGYGPVVTVRITSDFVSNVRKGAWLEGTADVSAPTHGDLLQVNGRLYSRRGTVLQASGAFQSLRRNRRITAR